MTSGTEWIIDAFGCSPARLADAEVLRRVCDGVIAEVGLTVVGEPLWHQFPAPGGVTGLYLLSESHLACHTWPEKSLATFNLFCCRPRPEFAWESRLTELLGADLVRVVCVPRGDESAREPIARRESFSAIYTCACDEPLKLIRDDFGIQVGCPVCRTELHSEGDDDELSRLAGYWRARGCPQFAGDVIYDGRTGATS